MTIEKNARTVLTLHMDDVRAGWEQWFLLSSDRHWDNPKTNLTLMRKHLDEAKRRDALVFDFGDLFCAMQGRFDPRSSKKDVRPEHQRSDYLDALVETAGVWFGPHADLFALIGEGNHETSIHKRHETNLTARLVERLNAQTGSKIAHGGFSGWVRFQFTIQGTVRTARNLYYHHGYGGDAPVTKGVIQTNRMAVYLPDADFVVTGHTHNEWIFPIARQRINKQGTLYLDEQLHIKLPSYKEEFGDGHGGWHIERGAPPKPCGAMWLRFYYDGSVPGCIASEVTRAK
jgi:hypothetical protein